jgi:SRSO17 transposase
VAVGIGGDVAFATKPQLAKAMIGRAVAAGVPFTWVTGDEAYGRARGAGPGGRVAATELRRRVEGPAAA